MAVAFDAASESHSGTTGASSVASFSWTHTPVGTPKGVLVFVYTAASTSDIITGVTYGGVSMSAVTGGRAVDSAGETGSVKAYFLGSGISTGAQTVEVTRTNDSTVTYACAYTVTAGANTSYTGVLLEEGDQALAEENVNDGSPGTNSVRFAGVHSGLGTLPAVGANSTSGNVFDPGAYGFRTVYETTAGQGSRPVGVTGASDDVAAVYLAVIESGGATITGSGSPASQSAATSGTATRTVTGSGTPTAQAATASGAAVRTITGTGTPESQASTVAGTGSVSGGAATITGSGTPQAQSATVAGTAEREITSPWSSAEVMGPLPFVATSAGLGTRYASPSGSGSAFTIGSPGPVRTAISGAVPGDVVFLRGGVYDIGSQSVQIRCQGTASQPIIIESYPGEMAIFEGSGSVYNASQYVELAGKYVQLRNVEIRNSCAFAALWVGSPSAPYPGTDNLIEHVYSHDNIGVGIQNHTDRNRYLSCTANDNSDAGHSEFPFANGGNSDGFSLSAGDQCRVEHCVALRNSDDGIDTWRSTRAYVGYCIVGLSGIADGDGNGIKAGGVAPSVGTIVERCLSYQNTAHGFDANGGIDVTFRDNTSWDNGNRGFSCYPTTLTENCISSSDATTNNASGTFTDNSWQRGGSVAFISTDPASDDFLVPTVSGGFEDIGAYSANAESYYSQPAAQLSIVTGTATRTVTGSGAPAAQSATVAGAGQVGSAVTGSGTPQSQASIVSGTATRTVTGSGMPTAQASTVSGTGQTGSAVSGSGTPQAQAATVAGTATRAITGSGSPQSQAGSVACTATRVITGAGTLAANSPVISGVALRVITGTGSLQAQPSAVVGVDEYTPAPDMVSVPKEQRQSTVTREIRRADVLKELRTVRARR